MGEVSGKKLQPDAFFLDTPSCQPCSRDEEFLPAEAFCTVCKEFLCSTCTSVHRKLKVSKGHTIQDKFSMPGSITGLENEMKHEDQDSQSCEKHPSEFIKYFCPEHQVCLCGHCLALKHRNCEVEIISEISNDFKDSQEYEDINADIAQLLEGIDRCSIDAERNISVVQRLGERELSKLRSYRKEVNKKFADREKELIDLIEIKRTADENVMRSFQTICVNLKTEVENVTHALRSRENNPIKLFIDAKRAKPFVNDMHTALDNISKQNQVHPYKFEKDPDTEKQLQSTTGLGTIKDIDFQIKLLGLRCHGKVSLKSSSDIDDCWLSSMLLLPGEKLLLADRANSTVKLVDLQTNSLMFQARVPGKPWEMCLLPRNMVAISLFYECKVQFLKLGKQLHVSLRDIINVDGHCHGIGYHNHRLIVGYLGGKLEILDLRGTVIKQLDPETTMYKNRQFVSPFSMTVVSECQTAVIYVSDLSKHTITKLDMDLNILQTFEDLAMRVPTGITAVGNQLLICGWESNNIMCLDLHSGQMTKLLCEAEGMQTPKCVCFSKQQNKLYVTSPKWALALRVYKASLFEDI